MPKTFDSYQTGTKKYIYRKHPCISRTFFHKIEAKNQGSGLSMDTPVFGVLKNLIFIKLLKIPRNKHKRNWSRLCLGVFIGESCSPRVLSSDYFSLTRTTKHQHTRNLLLFFTTFIANLSTALSGSCFAWSFLPIAGFQTSLYTWYPWTAESQGPDSFQHLKLGY